MPAKGVSNNPKGKPKGVQNKTTTEFKEAVNKFLHYAQPNMVRWLERIAVDDPAKALDIVAKLAEYAHPKLARTELAHEGEVGVRRLSPADEEILKSLGGKIVD